MIGDVDEAGSNVDSCTATRVITPTVDDTCVQMFTWHNATFGLNEPAPADPCCKASYALVPTHHTLPDLIKPNNVCRHDHDLDVADESLTTYFNFALDSEAWLNALAGTPKQLHGAVSHFTEKQNSIEPPAAVQVDAETQTANNDTNIDDTAPKQSGDAQTQSAPTLVVDAAEKLMLADAETQMQATLQIESQTQTESEMTLHEKTLADAETQTQATIDSDDDAEKLQRPTAKDRRALRRAHLQQPSA
jgi:hypothetical protein